MRADAGLAGRKVRCRGCERVVIAPLRVDDGEIKNLQRKVDPEALQGLLAGPRPPVHRRRKLAFGLAAAIVLIAFVILGWNWIVTGSSLPNLVQELPDGDFWIYRTSSGNDFFRAEPFPIEGTREVVTLYRGGTHLSAYSGAYSPDSLAPRFSEKGYRTEVVDGETLLTSPVSDEAVWLSARRALIGPRGMVADALAARKRRGPRFLDRLSPNQKRTLERLPRGEVLYFGKSSSVEEREMAGRFTRGLLQGVGSSGSGAGAAVRVVSSEEAAVTVVIGVGKEFEAQLARGVTARLNEFLEGLTVESREGVVTAQGRVFLSQLTMRWNETEALGVLTKLLAAQADFRDHDRDGNGVRDYWSGKLSGLRSFGLIDGELEAADPEATETARGPRRGYWFRAIRGREPGGFAFCAVPAQAGLTGRYAFLIHEAGIPYRKDAARETPSAWPADLSAEGWERCEFP